MRLIYLENKDIDREKWNAGIAAAANGQVYAYAWYLDAVADNWDAVIAEDYTYLMPLPWNAKWLGVKQIYQPVFTQQLGIFGKLVPDSELITRFFAAIPRHFRYIHLQLNEKNKLPRLPDFSQRLRVNMLLDLSKDYESLHKNFRKSLRQRIRKASTPLYFAENKVSPERLVDLYKENLNEKIGLSDSAYARVLSLFKEALRRDKGVIWSAHFKTDDRFATGIFFGKSHGRLVQLFGPSVPAGKKVNAKHFLLNEIIKKHAETDYILDFEGSEIPPIAEFFRGFNPEVVRYPLLVKDDFPWWVRVVKGLRG